MARNRQTVEVRNDYLRRFKKLKTEQLDSMQNIVLTVAKIPYLLNNTVRTLIDKWTIEGSCERAHTEWIALSGLWLFLILCLVFAYRWMKYVFKERKLMKSGEHPWMNCDERKFKKSLKSLRKSIDSLNKKWIAVFILLGTIIVVQGILLYLRIRELYWVDEVAPVIEIAKM